MENYIVKLSNVSLKYKFVRNIGIKEFFFSMLPWRNNTPRVKEVIALNNVSLKLKRGMNYGIIGANGAGKSTMLRLIAQIFQPDAGEVIVNTDSSSLLALGVGFAAELSGIENIYLNALLLGLRKKEVDELLPEIMAFADIGDFIYEPMKTYSSGMRSRLAFSTSINIQPELLLIDEVMGVGDENFQEKSSKRLQDLISGDRTVVLVSHSMQYIQNVCDQVIWLDKGKIRFIGEVEEGINKYIQFVRDMRKKAGVA